MRPRWVTRTHLAVVSSGMVGGGEIVLFCRRTTPPCHVSETKNRESKKARQGQHTHCHDGDENENVKKAIGWMGKTTSRLFVHFLPFLLYHDVEMPNFILWIWLLWIRLQKNSLALFCKRVGIISIEIERKSAPFLNDVFGTLNSTWATSLFFKFAKIETKESFVTRTNELLAGTLIYNRWRQREDRYCIKKGADLEVLIITVCVLDRRCSRRWVSIERNQTNEHVSRIQTGMLPQQGLLGIRRFVRH